MTKIYLDSDERLFLFDSLSKMENELRKWIVLYQQNSRLNFYRLYAAFTGKEYAI